MYISKDSECGMLPVVRPTRDPVFWKRFVVALCLTLLTIGCSSLVHAQDLISKDSGVLWTGQEGLIVADLDQSSGPSIHASVDTQVGSDVEQDPQSEAVYRLLQGGWTAGLGGFAEEFNGGYPSIVVGHDTRFAPHEGRLGPKAQGGFGIERHLELIVGLGAAKVSCGMSAVYIPFPGRRASPLVRFGPSVSYFLTGMNGGDAIGALTIDLEAAAGIELRLLQVAFDRVYILGAVKQPALNYPASGLRPPAAAQLTLGVRSNYLARDQDKVFRVARKLLGW